MRKFIDFLQLAGRSILHRKMRSWLTVIGVFIGITAVVALISIGLGLERTINEQVSGVFGVDNFVILNENAFGGGPHGGDADETEGAVYECGRPLAVDVVALATYLAASDFCLFGVADKESSQKQRKQRSD